MSGFNMPPGVSPSDIPGNDDTDEEGDMQAMAVMTLRDVFAALAMHAYVSSESFRFEHTETTIPTAYAIADLMLKERMKP